MPIATNTERREKRLSYEELRERHRTSRAKPAAEHKPKYRPGIRGGRWCWVIDDRKQA